MDVCLQAMQVMTSLSLKLVPIECKWAAMKYRVP